MKFLHLGDLHLGRTLGEYDLLDDQREMLDRILKIAEEEKVQGIVIAGDVYNRADPGEGAVALFDRFLRKIAQQGLFAFLISGNHDSAERMNFGASFFEHQNIFISALFRGNLYKRTVTDEYGTVNFYLMPFIRASEVREYFPEEEIKNYHDAVRCVIEKAAVDPKERNVILAHQFVTGRGQDPSLSGSEGPSCVHVGLVERIGAELFDDFDYAALGHIHKPQAVGREEVRYSGSMLKYSLSEAGDKKSVPVVSIGKKGDVSITLVPLTPRRDLRHIKGTLKQLLSPENIVDTQDFIHVTLLEEELVNDAMAIFRNYYPNTVRIDYDNGRIHRIDEEALSDHTKAKSFEELFSDFYRMVYGMEISDSELSAMKEIAGEAGGEDETN